MTKNLRYLSLVLLSSFWVLATPLLAQNTITTQALLTTSICPGSTFDVPFTISGSYPSSNVFTVQLSNGGDYTNIATSGISYSNATGRYTVTATIPATTAAGTTYKVRVNASSPAVIGSPSTTVLTVKTKPEVPVVQGPQSICQSQGAMQQVYAIPINVTATAGSGATASLYTEAGYPAGGDYTPNTTTGNVTTFNIRWGNFGHSDTPKFPVAETNLYAAQTVNGCQSDLIKTTVRTLYWPASGPKPANQVAADYGLLTYCQGEQAQPLNVNGHGAPIENYRILYKGPEPYAGYIPDGVFTTDAPTPPTSTTGQTTYTFKYDVIDPTKSCNPRNSASLNHYAGESYLQVLINAKPSKPLSSPNTLTYCQNQTANLLTASATDASASLVWYGTVATGGTGSSNAPRPSTTTAGTFKYYVAQRLNNCESDRAEITVVVRDPPAQPPVIVLQQDCQAVTTMQRAGYRSVDVKTSGGTARLYDDTGKQAPYQYSDGSGGTAHFYFFGSFFGSSDTYKYPVSEKIFYSTQVIDGCESEKVAIKVQTLFWPTTGPTLANRYSVNYGQISYCQGEQAQPLNVNGNSPSYLENYRIVYRGPEQGATFGQNPPTPPTSLTGRTAYTLKFEAIDLTKSCNPILTPFTPYVESYLQVDIKPRPPKPTVLANVLTLCQSQEASPLSATTTDASASLVWYGIDATNGTGATTATKPATDKAGTFKYYVAQRQNDCEGDRAEIIVEVKAASPAPTVASLSYCVGVKAGQLSAVAASGGSLTWYATSSGGTGMAAAPTPSTDNPGGQTYYVAQTVGASCESSRIPLVVMINGLPPAPVMNTTSIKFCQNTMGVALSASGQNIKWYDVAAGGTGSSDTFYPATSVAGTKNYYASQTVNGCEGPRSSLLIDILEAPTAPVVSQTNYEFCQGTTGTISATIVPSATIAWTALGSSPEVVSKSTNGNTAFATVITDQARTIAYSLSQKAVNGCSSPASLSVTITVKSTPAAPTTQAVDACVGMPAPTLQPTGQGLLWYPTATGGTGSTSTPTVSTSQASQYTYYVTQTVSGCESGRATQSVTINGIPNAPTVGTALAYCQNAAAAALEATGESIKWYDTTTGGTGSGNLTPKTDASGDFTYYATQTIKNCESGRASLVVKVNAAPNVPTTSPAVSYCQKETPAQLKADGTSVKWYIGGTTSTTAPVPSTDSPGTVSYFVTQTVEKCESAKAEIKVTIKATPGAPGTSALAVCQNTPVTLSANGSSLRWYTAASGGDGSATPPPVNTGQPVQITYYVSQSLENCEGPRAALPVMVKSLPPMPIGPSKTSYCQADKSEAIAASGEGLIWYNADDSPYGSQAPIITTDVGRTFTYKVTQTVNGCVSPKATVTIVVQTTPMPTVAKSVLELCQGSVADPLKADGTGLRWTDPTGAVSTTAPVPPTLNATRNPDGDIFYVTQTGSNGCESPKAAIKVFVQTVPTLSLSGATTVNLGIEAPIKFSFTGVGPYSYTLSDGSTGSTTKDTTVLVLPTRTTTYQIAQVKNKCGVGLPGNGAAVTITVMVPVIQTLTLPSSTLCVGTQLTTNYVTTGSFNTGSVFKLQVAKVESDSTKLVYTDLVNGSVTGGQITGTIPATVAAGQYRVRVIATNPKIPINGLISPTVLTIRATATATLTGTQSIYETQTAKLSIALMGEAPWTVTYQDSSYATGLKGMVQTLQVVTSPYTLDVKPDKTTAYLLTSVSNSCGVGARGAASAVITVAPLLAVKESFSIDVFPVPVTTSVTVRVKGSSAQKPALLTLTDVNGRLIQQQQMGQDTGIMSLSQQPAGAYILRVNVGDQVVSKRILKL